ncbi:MAG: HDOD domain-containing protein [Phycisphaeraceae bacterium]|nr:HDOD domain-containing protein [Phycisphaeraceae bacterium]
MSQAATNNRLNSAAPRSAGAVPPRVTGTPAANTADPVVQTAVKEISHIATLPEVTLKIIKLVEDPDSTAQDLNKIITNDPALGARILKVVNSAFYGLPGQIGSINRAIVLLGLNAVKNIAIAASLAKLFRGGQICPNFNARDLWNHSIAVGTGTRLLAEKVGLGLPDEAFLAGLIHDLGIMVEMQARRQKFVEAIEKLDTTPGLTLRAAETATLGATHEQFGAALCKAWKFPLSFSYVTGFHHHPMDVIESSRTLTGLVHVADIVAAKLALGFTRTVETDQIPTDLLAALNLTTTHVEEMSKALPSAVKDAATLLSDSV